MSHDAFHQDLVARGVLPPLARRFVEPTELTWRHRLLARLMVHGCADAGMLAFIRRRTHEKVAGKTVWTDAPPPEPYEPLAVDEAASLAGLRRRYARQLIESEIFKGALRAEKRALRGSGAADHHEEGDDA